MKINWGWKLLITYVIFVGVTLSLVLFMTTVNSDKVIENYYEEELKYQDKIDMIKRANDLPQKPAINLDSAYVKIQLPDFLKTKKISGNILFYRPNSKAMDINLPFVPDTSGQQVIPITNLAAGKWKIELSWQLADVKYFQDEVIMLR
ncbi:MAG: FixH family protein [Rhodothermaceae bacterium]